MGETSQFEAARARGQLSALRARLVNRAWSFHSRFAVRGHSDNGTAYHQALCEDGVPPAVAKLLAMRVKGGQGG